MRRRLAIAGGLALVVAVAVVVQPFGGSGGDPEARPAAPAATAEVRRGPLSSQVYDNGTLGYAARADGSPYAVVNRAAGAYTALPAAGDVVRCGEPLYRVADEPVALLCGRAPLYRTLSEGMSGADVRRLNRSLADLGYEVDRSSDEFGADTAEAVERLQDELGVDETGVLELGQAVMLPGPLRITRVTATPGAQARPGAPIAEATSTRRHAEVALDASQASSVKRGDRVQVTLPNNRTTPGVVTRVGTVAAAEREGEPATVPVSVRLRRPKDVRGLDEAPVRVQITTDGVDDALSVPVTALVALAGGGYAVETVGAGGERELVPVELGLFDHAAGAVEVRGELEAGQRVVVPAS